MYIYICVCVICICVAYLFVYLFIYVFMMYLCNYIFKIIYFSCFNLYIYPCKDIFYIHTPRVSHLSFIHPCYIQYKCMHVSNQILGMGTADPRRNASTPNVEVWWVKMWRSGGHTHPKEVVLPGTTRTFTTQPAPKLWWNGLTDRLRRLPTLDVKSYNWTDWWNPMSHLRPLQTTKMSHQEVGSPNSHRVVRPHDAVL